MNLRPMTVESYIKESEEVEISPTTLKVKLYNYYYKNMQPVNYEKISKAIDGLIEKGIVHKIGDKFILS